MADFDFGGLLGNAFGANSGSEIEKLLTAQQRQKLGTQSALSAAAALLQAGGRGPQRVSLGQALGSALQAGQGAYERGTAGAINELMLGQKLKEMQAESAGNESWRRLLGGAPSPVAAAGAAQPMPTGAAVPTVEQEMAAPAPAQADPLAFLNPVQRALIANMPRKEGMSEVLKVASSQAEFGKPEPVVMNGKTVMVQYNKLGESRIAKDVSPYEAQSPDIRAVEYISGKPLAGTGPEGISAVGQYRQQIAPKTQVTVPVDMTGGQKGFENEMKLSGAFKNEPIYKDYNDMKSAYSQVVSSLSQGTPIGDVAGATKVMKLLDPGSVVRESELGIAMAASGRMDRLNNYFSNMMSGQKLTPTQREDFKALSNELYAAAGQAYNQKRKEYEQFGDAYGFKNLNTALGAPATIPSVMRGGAGGTARPSLGSIFNK
jgi:Spy/CpxP family protein refolding chaperone